ncbi:MAG: GNAT family N-acetyltransferase [Gemmatimonadota bacterium]|jgi:GNAT superfamily N-acetyltransferase|nr:GNAT family N-acetyltransferase [Gemmatimonadota bacterium]MDQ8168174.1 GNAT family N-acetyltransferase [Gemmatimonadota bacterium]MDQ8172309.1 GNAT family N-acetyltransferase [Gemmatimonadota bacterium]
MSTPTRSWRSLRPLAGPVVATLDDIPQLNEVFAEAFTDRYRKDGMAGVRVPPLSPAIWRYAIEDAGDGALCWRDERGRIAAFNIAHHSGTEGWMGPLCVRPDQQGGGLGKIIVQSGMQWLRRQRVTVIGLETMPRTMDNIGFYSNLGFVPGHLTVTLTLEAAPAERAPVLLSRCSPAEKDAAIAACRALTMRVMPGYDFTRELELTDRLALGDTIVMGPLDAPTGFATCHTAPLVDGRTRDELRVLKLVLAQRRDLPPLLGSLADLARRSGTRRVAIRLQGDYPEAYRTLIALGARVRWTDLRMSASGWTEVAPRDGMVLSNWEI